MLIQTGIHLAEAFGNNTHKEAGIKISEQNSSRCFSHNLWILPDRFGTKGMACIRLSPVWMTVITPTCSQTIP